MTKQYWLGVAGFGVLAIVGGAFFDVIAVAGSAVVAMAGTHAKRRVH